MKTSQTTQGLTWTRDDPEPVVSGLPHVEPSPQPPLPQLLLQDRPQLSGVVVLPRAQVEKDQRLCPQLGGSEWGSVIQQ